MIIDTIRNCDSYPFERGSIKRAIEFLRTTDFSKYSDGKHIIDEDLMHVIVSTYTTENGTEKLFEAHRKYIDIQFMIRGRESIYWSPLENLSPRNQYSEDDDIIFFQGVNLTLLPMKEGYFCIFFPEDAHKPGCISDKPEKVRKAVIKILL